MKTFVLLLLLSVGAWAQFTPPPSSGGAAIGCVGTPGNTVAAYRVQCLDLSSSVWICKNSAGCTLAADWVSVTGSGSFSYPGAGVACSTGSAWCSSYAVPWSPANGGTGANNTVGAAGHVLRSNGTDYVDSAIQAADVPTLNQNTTGSAASATTATTATNLASGAVGSLPYQSAAATTAMLGGNTAATDQVVVSHGTGAAALAPTLTNAPALSAANMTSFPTLNQSTTGNAATATALAATPSQCSGSQFATGITASGAANCATPSGGGGTYNYLADHVGLQSAVSLTASTYTSLYSYTLAANAVPAGGCIQFSSRWFHSTGTDALTPEITLGGTVVVGGNGSWASASTTPETWVFRICNRAGSTANQDVYMLSFLNSAFSPAGSGYFGSVSVNTTTSLVLSFALSPAAASGDQATLQSAETEVLQ